MKWIARFEIVLGVWFMISPWILGFSSFSPALWGNVIGGAAVGILGLWRTFGDDAKME